MAGGLIDRLAKLLDDYWPVLLMCLSSTLIMAVQLRRNGILDAQEQAALDSIFAKLTLPVQKPIHKILPAETLSMIFENLSETTDLHAVRLQCRAFERAAWPVFAKSFSHRVFHPTLCSLSNLRRFSKNKGAAPYLKELHISTATVHHEKGSRSFEIWKRDYLSPELTQLNDTSETSAVKKAGDEYLDMLRRETDLSSHNLRGNKLWKALKHLPNLERVVIVDGDQLSALPKFPCISRTSQEILHEPNDPPRHLFDMHAHRQTTGLLFGFPQSLFSEKLAPQITSLFTLGSISLDALPYCYCSAQSEDLPHMRASSIKHVNLSVTDKLRSIATFTPEYPQTFRLEAFLHLMPNLTILSLGFPKQSSLLRSQSPLDNSFGFNRFLRSCAFPCLHTFQLSNVDICDILSMEAFYFTHRKTLKVLGFRNITMAVFDMKPIKEYMHQYLALDDIIYYSEVTAEDETQQREMKRRFPELWPSAKDFKKAAKRTTFRAPGRKDHVYVRDEQKSGSSFVAAYEASRD